MYSLNKKQTFYLIYFFIENKQIHTCTHTHIHVYACFVENLTLTRIRQIYSI